MNIKQAKLEIKNTVSIYLEKTPSGEYKIPSVRQRPVLLMGPPGIGKTQIMEQIAKECDIGLVAYTITHHTRQTAVGLPFITEKVYDGQTVSVTEYTMSEIISSIYDSMEKTGKNEGILFIDEINCVSETLAPTMLQFLQNKTFGNRPIPSGWIIVACGNPPAYNKSVREFDVVTLDRVRLIDVEASYEAWEPYATDAGVHRAILAYLKLHPDHFYVMETDVDGKHFVTARGWEDLSHLLYAYKRKDIPVTKEVVYEYLRSAEVSEDFTDYLMLYAKYEEEYPVTEILAGEVSSVIYERLLHAGFDERIAVVELILAGLFRLIRENDKSAKEAMENAFSFMENAFSDGQEMVIFVTELTMTADAVLFLADYPNDKYLKYSESLLIGTRRGELLSEIHQLEK